MILSEISYEDVGGEESGYAIGDTVEIDVSDELLESEGFGRIASQAAKQVIVQKIGETEKEKLYHLFKDKVDYYCEYASGTRWEESCSVWLQWSPSSSSS
jgi:hypothetical protein